MNFLAVACPPFGFNDIKPDDPCDIKSIGVLSEYTLQQKRLGETLNRDLQLFQIFGHHSILWKIELNKHLC